MSKEQYRQAYGAIRYICHDHDNYDYAPKNYRHRDAGKELARLPWLVVGAAYVSWEVGAWTYAGDPLNHPMYYWGLFQKKQREQTERDAERKYKAFEKKLVNSVLVPKDEYERLKKLAGL